MSGPIKMHYFPIAGRGELIRLICAAGDLELVAGEELTAEQKLEFCSPGSVPLMDHGGFKLAQSNAIECYVAGLVPKFAALTPQQKATDQMVALIQGDMLGDVAKEAFGGKDAAVITKACDKWLTVLEAKIPTEGFINGLPFPTVADLAVYNICTGYIPFGASYKIASYDVSKFPKVSALAERTKEHACLKDFESATQSAAAFGL